MDIKKELLKLRKDRIIKIIVALFLLAIGLPFYIAGGFLQAVYIAPIGIILSFIGLALLLRTAFHPNYYNLKGEIAGYDKCKQLHMCPPRGKSEDLDKRIKALEFSFLKQGNDMLGGQLSADKMTSEDVALIKRTLTSMGDIDKATDEALFKTYAHLCSQASLGGLAKNKHSRIQKECVFRILYCRYYHIIKE